MFAQWDDKYSVKIPQIDDQHKKLFSLLSSLHEKISQGKAKAILEPLLKELEDYTQYHFKTEEDFMIQTQYSEYQEHKKAHQYFIEKITEFKKQFEQMREVSAIPIEIWIFLKDWLISHILKMDHDYAPFFKSKGIQ